MRERILMMAAAFCATAIPVGAAASGCTDLASDCYERRDCCPDGTLSCFSGPHDGGPDADGSVPPGCVPNESTTAVADICGVFVSSSLGDDSSAGTKEKPLKTIGAALAKGKPVYACGEDFAEAVSIAASATLYGALDCTKGWLYDASKRTHLTAAADALPLAVTKATTSAEVNDFAITAADATKDGGSSIAVLVAQAALSLTRCDVTAGNGKVGLAGAAWMAAAQSGIDGLPGADACAASTSLGGDAVLSMCGTPDSVSGAGGIGGPAAGGNGSDGQPGTTTNGGKGEGAAACVDGAAGDPGTSGTAGTGASGLGTLSAGGYAGVAGGEGGPGTVAQGGGGGGGAKGETTASVCPAGMGGGASGGSGGSGGCGGLGGKGGSAGGASIAIVSLAASLTFASVTIKVGSGGAGGDGGVPEAGGGGGAKGAGGKGKNALKAGCAGGPGGKGGDGGKGGGGLGGHAIGIAASSAAPPTIGVTFTKGTAGAGGKGDNASGNMGDGAPGVVADVQVFP
jgi:hypothetical protein